MIENLSLIDKTYENLIDDALYQIPLICEEWTNFNPSDPGMTIVENLSAVNILQQTAVDRLNKELKLKLLGLLGLKRKRLEAQDVILCYEGKEDIKIPTQTSFLCEDFHCENEKIIVLKDNPILKVYVEKDGERKTLSRVLDKTTNSSVYAWGEEPKIGSCMYFLMKKNPIKMCSLYVKVDDKTVMRNPLDEDNNLNFSKESWQIFSEGDWIDVDANDNTQGFLYSGCIDLKLNEVVATVYEEDCYAIRCVLKESNFDVAPKINKIYSNIFKVKQQKSYVTNFTFNGGRKKFSINSQMIKNGGRCYVYVLTEDGYYRECKACLEEEFDSVDDIYKYKVVEHEGSFLKIEIGHRVMQRDDVDAVKIVVYSKEYMNKRELCEIYAYDNQEIKLEIENIAPNAFECFVSQVDKDGKEYFAIAKAGIPGIDGFLYVIEDNKIIIKNPGIAGDGKLIATSVVCTKGKAEILRENSVFTYEELTRDNPFELDKKEELFISTAPSLNGSVEESVEDMRARFIKEFGTAATAVTAQDYKEIIARTPGLAIRKVNVGVNHNNNLVKLVVMPYSMEEQPEVSEKYKDKILKYVDKHRLLTTNVILEQPKYVPIEVNGEIFAKAHHKNAQSLVDALLEELLDYVNSDKGFGEKIVFGEIYNKIEKLSCVEYIRNLSIKVQGPNGRTSIGEDIQLDYNELCYLKSTNIKIIDQF